MKLIRRLAAILVFTFLLNLPQASAAPITHLNVPVKDFVTLYFYAFSNGGNLSFAGLPGTVKVPAGRALVVTDVSWECKMTSAANLGKLGTTMRIFVNKDAVFQTTIVPYHSAYTLQSWYSGKHDALTSGIVLRSTDILGIDVPGCNDASATLPKNEFMKFDHLNVLFKGYYIDE